MLRVDPTTPPLNSAERFALATLLDLTRIVPLEKGGEDAVELRIVGSAVTRSVSECRDRGWYLQPREGAVEMPRGLLTLITEIAGAVREQRSAVSDRYGRVPSAENELVASGLEDDPVVNRIAQALRRSVSAAAGRRRLILVAPWPKGKRWAVAMTHDLDVVSAWPVFTSLRIAELLGKGHVGRALQVMGSAAASVARDPIWRAASQILEVERTAGLRSTWFVITGTPTLGTMRAGDVTYTAETPAARRILQAASADGHELALHGSFSSYTSAGEFTRQRERLAAIAGQGIQGVRQHFLRMRPGKSHRAMAEAAFQYDSTFGFADRNGFRLGVADVVPVWDDAEQQALPLDAVPFLWMDRALSKYRGVEEPNEWIDDALRIAAICRDVEGVWNGIWHPNLTRALGYPGAPQAFARLVHGLRVDDPWSATLAELVAWRRLRRAAHALGTNAAGEVMLRADPSVVLEDLAGRPVATAVV